MKQHRVYFLLFLFSFLFVNNLYLSIMYLYIFRHIFRLGCDSDVSASLTPAKHLCDREPEHAPVLKFIHSFIVPATVNASMCTEDTAVRVRCTLWLFHVYLKTCMWRYWPQRYNREVGMETNGAFFPKTWSWWVLKLFMCSLGVDKPCDDYHSSVKQVTMSVCRMTFPGPFNFWKRWNKEGTFSF